MKNIFKSEPSKEPTMRIFIEFSYIFFYLIQGDVICVSSLQNVTNSEEVEKAILNKYMKPKLLIKVI